MNIKDIKTLEKEKFNNVGEVKIAGNITSTPAITETEAKKQALLDASDLNKTFTYGTHDGIRMIETISYSSTAIDTFYSENITMVRTIVYTASTAEINTITDVLTII